MYQVVNRDNKVVEFDVNKIINAISKAFDSLDKLYNRSTLELLALRVTADFSPKIKDRKITVEDIQDSVETVLIQAGYADVAKAYILYRKQREKARNVKGTLLDYKQIIDNYLKVNDWRVKENSTVTYSVGGLILSNSGAITANYWLAHRLLRGLVAPSAHQRGSGRRSGQDNLLARQAPCHSLQPDGKLPRHNAERMGGRAGVQLLRHLSRALRKSG